MKVLILIISVLIIGFIYTSCGEEEDTISEQPKTLIDLTGEWLGVGFQCPPETYSERIEISHNVETLEVIATKITGDPCVPEGHLTFEGNYNGTDSDFSIFFCASPTGANIGCDNFGSVDVINSERMFVNLYNRLLFTKTN